MDEPMTSFARRRIRNVSILAALSAGFAWLHQIYTLSLNPPSFFSGWTLAGLALLLLLFSIRKKLLFLPLGNAAAWAQAHYYAGIFSLWVFGTHVEWGMPSGLFERALFFTFLLASGSGLMGLALSRVLPRRLARYGDPIVFQRIRPRQMEIQKAAAALVKESLDRTGSTTISGFYRTRLLLFFKPAAHFQHHLFDTGLPLRRLLKDLDNLERYLDAQERHILASIRELVREKDTLDSQYAVQVLLRAWLFVHIPAAWTLLCLVPVHMVLVYAFHGG